MKVLYSFCAQTGCTDGVESNPVIMDQAGDLYGTTQGGGTQDRGVIFELSPGQHGGYNYQILYNFCSESNCADGGVPIGSLVIDTSGNLYGVSRDGGNFNSGDVFELVANGGQWTFDVVYSFCSLTNCTDGGGPFAGITYSGAVSGMPYDGTSPLFGTTVGGGAHGNGAAYALQPNKNAWSEQAIYSFCPQEDCPDGSSPYAPLLVDESGNLYGTTFEGGNQNGGVLFELSPNGGGWDESVLKNFGFRFHHLLRPFSGVAMNPAGDLIGFSQYGGNHPKFRIACRRDGCGGIYSLSPDQGDKAYTQLYKFCSLTSCLDGGWPTSDLYATPPLLDPEGNIFGTASVGGTTRLCGTLFELSGPALQVLYDFGKKKAAGCSPANSLFRDSSGRLYGTTLGGGANGRGTIFRYDP
jgi:uncharacterized repeat protein (TIGR03803 family)